MYAMQQQSNSVLAPIDGTVFNKFKNKEYCCKYNNMMKNSKKLTVGSTIPYSQKVVLTDKPNYLFCATVMIIPNHG